MDRGKRCCGIDLGTYKITICCRGENGAIQWMDGRVQGRNWDYSSVYYQPGKEKIPCYIPPSIHQGDVLLTDTKRFFGRCDCPEVQEDVKKVRYPVSCKHGQIGFEVPGKDGMTISTTAEEVATDFLKRLREATKLMTREYINYAVISHPATWSILQKNRLTECAKEAGFTSISLIEEPTATAYDMLSFDADDGYYLIYDWGGGTFDLTLLEMEKGVATVKGTDGLRYVGGMDMDSLLVEYVKNQYTQLEGEDSWPTSLSTNWKVANDCREGKCSLATSAEVCIPVGEKEVVVTREAFNGLIKGLVDQTLEKCRSLLREKGVEVEDVEKVVLAGGVSKIPYVQERVKELFGEDVVEYKDDIAEKGVARGALVFGEHFTPFNRVEKDTLVPETVERVEVAEETKPKLEDSFSFNVYVDNVVDGVPVKRLVLEKGELYGKEKEFLLTMTEKDKYMRVNVYIGKTDAEAECVGSFVFEADYNAIARLFVRCEQGRYLSFRSSWSMYGENHESACQFELGDPF